MAFSVLTFAGRGACLGSGSVLSPEPLKPPGGPSPPAGTMRLHSAQLAHALPDSSEAHLLKGRVAVASKLNEAADELKRARWATRATSWPCSRP